MKKQLMLPRHRTIGRWKFSFLALFTLCMILLSACSMQKTTSFPSNYSSTSLSMPVIDASLKNQGTMQLETFQQWIMLMKQNGVDTTTYQQQYDTDQLALQNAQTKQTYTTALNTLETQVSSVKFPAMKAEDLNLQHKLQQQVQRWGKQHTYYNSYDNTTYPLGYEYSDKGIGGWAQDDLNSAQTLADYQQAIENAQMYLSNFQAMTDNSHDQTAYNLAHKSDLELMKHYNKLKGKVIVVSLGEQVMRVYDHGKLVNAFLVTTGRPDRPSIPGVWWVEGKQAHTTFKSGVPKSSPEYYPDTPINFAMQYHSNGYFIHDSWWRNDYGPGTNFPHQDSSGDIFSSQGSHGCVNISKSNAGWLYNYVQIYTSIIIY